MLGSFYGQLFSLSSTLRRHINVCFNCRCPSKPDSELLLNGLDLYWGLLWIRFYTPNPLASQFWFFQKFIAYSDDTRTILPRQGSGKCQIKSVGLLVKADLAKSFSLARRILDHSNDPILLNGFAKGFVLLRVSPQSHRLRLAGISNQISKANLFLHTKTWILNKEPSNPL